MENPNRFYTYAYLREDGTPYYIGKGHGRRIVNRQKRDIKPPKNKSRVIFLKQNLTEEKAFEHEKYMIFLFGRKDLATGILHNKTNGGEGSSGFYHKDETKIKIGNANRNPSTKTREKMSKSRKGKINSEETKIKIKKSLLGNSRAKGNKIDRNIVERLSNQRKQSKWWNNGIEQTFCAKCPDGWFSGRLPLTGNYSKPGKLNPKSKIWQITYTDGKTEIINCLSQWCKSNNYHPNTVRSAMRKNRTYKNILKIKSLGNSFKNDYKNLKIKDSDFFRYSP